MCDRRSCRVSLRFSKDSLEGASSALPFYLCYSTKHQTPFLFLFFSLPYFYSVNTDIKIEAGTLAGTFIHPVDSKCLEMSELRLYAVQQDELCRHTNMTRMSVMREIEDYVLDRPLTLTSAYYKKMSAACSHPQLVNQHQTMQVDEAESPQSPSDSAEEWVDAPTLLPGTYVRMWLSTPLCPWLQGLHRESDSQEFCQ